MSLETPLIDLGPCEITRTNGVNLVDLDPDGIKTISGYRSGLETVSFKISLSALSQDQIVNFFALAHKCAKHLTAAAGYAPGSVIYRTRMWRKYWRNKLDEEHGCSKDFGDLVKEFLSASGLRFLVYDNGALVVHARNMSGLTLAVLIGRIVNMLRWCRHWTSTFKLVSEKDMSLATYNAISLKCDQALRNPRSNRSSRPPVGQISVQPASRVESRSS